jgi:hypothetical protein
MNPRELSTFCFRRYYEESETIFSSIESKKKIGPAFVVDDALAYRLEGTEFKDWDKWAPAGRYVIKSVYLFKLSNRIKETGGKFMCGLFVILNRYNFRTTALVYQNRVEAIVYSCSPKAEGMGKLDIETLECTFDEAWTRAIDAWPMFDVKFWSCGSNEWYGIRKILHEYIGLKTDIPLLGKLQQSWQPSMCTGIDGEQGYSAEVKNIDTPVYVWSSACFKNAREKGLRATAIGSPWLYLREEDERDAPIGLLAFPTHSFNQDFRAKIKWDIYAKELKDTEKRYGFSHTTICIHKEDWSDEVVNYLSGCGFKLATLGDPLSNTFLYRARSLIRSHAAVTSDRLCSSAFYSLYENVPFFISGTPILMEPEEPVVGLQTIDRQWIGYEFPGLLAYDGKARKEYGDRELGAENKKTPSELREILYGWAGL